LMSPWTHPGGTCTSKMPGKKQVTHVEVDGVASKKMRAAVKRSVASSRSNGEDRHMHMHHTG
jgi:hypothetical protein